MSTITLAGTAKGNTRIYIRQISPERAEKCGRGETHYLGMTLIMPVRVGIRDLGRSLKSAVAIVY